MSASVIVERPVDTRRPVSQAVHHQLMMEEVGSQANVELTLKKLGGRSPGDPKEFRFELLKTWMFRGGAEAFKNRVRIV